MSDPNNPEYPRWSAPQSPQPSTNPDYLQQYGHYQPTYYAPPYGQASVPEARRTNGLAIASMVLGILWIYWVGSILALVFGYVARRQIHEQNQYGDGMAIAGVVLGWVGIGVLGLVILLGIVSSLSY